MTANIAVNLAVEDDLSEMVLRRILDFTSPHMVVDQCAVGGGFGYLKRQALSYNRAARFKPFVVLTDLDQADCPASLIDAWIKEPRHPNFLLRVAVREVESWLLADRGGFAGYLGVSLANIPREPDALPDPKRSLIQIAKRSRRREIREAIVPDPKASAVQGPDYNACLARFVATKWDVEIAATCSPSLRRTMDRFSKFSPQ